MARVLHSSASQLSSRAHVAQRSCLHRRHARVCARSNRLNVQAVRHPSPAASLPWQCSSGCGIVTSCATCRLYPCCQGTPPNRHLQTCHRTSSRSGSSTWCVLRFLLSTCYSAVKQIASADYSCLMYVLRTSARTRAPGSKRVCGCISDTRWPDWHDAA
jgi:hypothetical protein